MATAINFQPSGATTVSITGDFALTAGEVNAVAGALRSNGIDVTASHQHHLNEQPRLFYMIGGWSSSPATATQRLVVMDLQSMTVTESHDVGTVPDVLAFDKGFGRLYVSAESGIITIFDEHGRNLEKVGEGFFAANAHTVAVDHRTHRVYFPLQNVGGKPVLRIAVPTDKQL